MALTPEIEQKIVEALNKIEDIKVLQEALSILNPQQQAPAQLEQAEQPAEATPEADKADTATAPEATKVADAPENQTVRPKADATEYKDYKGKVPEGSATSSSEGQKTTTDVMSYNSNSEKVADAPQPKEQPAPTKAEAENQTVRGKDIYKNTQYQTFKGSDVAPAEPFADSPTSTGGQDSNTDVLSYNSKGEPELQPVEEPAPTKDEVENQTVRGKDIYKNTQYQTYKGSNDANAARTSASGDRDGNTDRLSYNANEQHEVPQEEPTPANDEVENSTVPAEDRYKNTQYQTYRGDNGDETARTSASGGQGDDTIVRSYNGREQQSGYRIQGDLGNKVKSDGYKSYNLDPNDKAPDSSRASARTGTADNRADSGIDDDLGEIDTKNSEEFESGLEQALGQRNKEGIRQKVKNAVRNGFNTITGKNRRERKANEKIAKDMTDEMLRNSMYDSNQTYAFLKNYFAQIDEDYQGLVDKHK